jgi:polyisoprenoid-binding protein YceI
MKLRRLLLAFSLIATAGTFDAQAQLRRYDFDVARSQLFVVTHRSGVFASVFGHEHVITANSWAGAFCWAPEAATTAQGAVTVDTRSLEIDRADARKLAKLGNGPSEGQLKTIRKKFVDEQHLDTARYAQMRLTLQGVSKTDRDRTQLNGQLTMRGVTRDVAFPIDIKTAGEELQLSGTLTVRQSEFGIKPESIAGVVKVKDPIDIHFNGIAQPLSGGCPVTLP